MKGLDENAAARRKTAQVLLSALALFAAHRTLSVLATGPLAILLQGYSDADLLRAGGDLPLELVLLHEDALPSALRTAALWLLGGRAATFLASFLVHRTAFSLAALGQGRPEDTRPLHLAWALALTLGATLSSSILLLLLGFTGLRLGRWLRAGDAAAWPTYLAGAALALGFAWLVCAVLFDLYRLALAGARRGPIAGAKLTARAFRQSSGRLLLGRLALATATITVGAAGVLLLPAVTRASNGQRALAMLAIDLALLGAVCLRAAWLTWASAHLVYGETVGLTPANYEGVPPSAEPAVPADPSPSPDA